MLNHELESTLGLPLEAINWHTNDFRELPTYGRCLLMGADGKFREPRNDAEVTEYLIDGELYEVEEQQADDDDEEGLILWL